MLSLLFYHIVSTSICALAGSLFYALIKIPQNKPFLFYPVTGLITITLLVQIITLLTAINAIVFIVITGLLLVGCFYYRKSILTTYQTFVSNFNQLHAIQLLLIFSVWFLILVLNAGPTMMDDTESYHIQMIKWIHEYGTVPGLANLHERYGFNSSWFSSISFFLPSSSSVNFYTSLNGVLSFWFSSYLILQLPISQKQEFRSHRLHYAFGFLAVLLLSLFCWPLIRGNASTANYDFITTIVIFVLFAETMKNSRFSNDTTFPEEWFIWPVYLFTIRVINFPLLLLSLYSFWFFVKQKKWQQLALFSGIAFLLLTPYIGRTILLSGYPFYPATQFDWFQVDWKVDDKTVQNLLRFIKYFNRVNNRYMEIGETEKIGFPNWIPVWYHYLFTYDKWLLIPGLAGFVLFFLKQKKKFPREVHFFVAVLVLQLLSCFLVAPDPRFVYGCLLVGVFLLTTLVVKSSIEFQSKGFKDFIAIPLSVFLLCFAGVKIFRSPEYQNYFLPFKLPQPSTTEVTIDGYKLFIPQKLSTNWNARCYATDLPCLYMIKEGLKARGPSIRDGFRTDKR